VNSACRFASWSAKDTASDVRRSSAFRSALSSSKSLSCSTMQMPVSRARDADCRASTSASRAAAAASSDALRSSVCRRASSARAISCSARSRSAPSSVSVCSSSCPRRRSRSIDAAVTRGRSASRDGPATTYPLAPELSASSAGSSRADPATTTTGVVRPSPRSSPTNEAQLCACTSTMTAAASGLPCSHWRAEAGVWTHAGVPFCAIP
jgi:hypothetical protein